MEKMKNDKELLKANNIKYKYIKYLQERLERIEGYLKNVHKVEWNDKYLSFKEFKNNNC